MQEDQHRVKVKQMNSGGSKPEANNFTLHYGVWSRCGAMIVMVGREGFAETKLMSPEE
jgi:hypothetical protein